MSYLFIGEGEACVPPSYGAEGITYLPECAHPALQEAPRQSLPYWDPTPEQWEIFWAMGDVNRDGYINDVDVALLQAAFGSRPGDSNWDARCDLNGDDFVDITDINIAARNYGLSIWEHFAPPIDLPLLLLGGAFAIGLIYLILK